MIAPTLIRAASANLVDTYVRLGCAVEGAELVEEDEFLACLGKMEHPICNFATRLNIDPWSARRLGDLAAARQVFSVYALPGDKPEHLAEILVRSGFRASYELSQMICEHPDPGPAVEMRMAETPADRQEVATFMGEQFFSRHNDAFRRQIASATARATGLGLYDLRDRAHRIAAVMLGDGGGVLGVYNLCVASARRGRGIGRAVLDWALTLARESGRAVTLQCDPMLEGWYCNRGFVPTGRISVYTLSKRKEDDIIL